MFSFTQMKIASRIFDFLRASIPVFTVMIFTQPAFSDPIGDRPVKVLIAGVSHGHVDWILARDRNLRDIEIVGLQDQNSAHLQWLAQKYNFQSSMLFRDLDQAIEATRPDGVLAFGAVDEHLAVVRSAVRARIPVMMEKPLAHRLEDAVEMQRLSEQSGIPLLVNYESNWYPALERVMEAALEPKRLPISRLSFETGHWGPIELGAKPEFLDWLLKPERGGGALLDFGVYGAGIATVLLEGQSPVSVQADVRTTKPHLYPGVEDDAHIRINYAQAQVEIHASWSLPSSLKTATISTKDEVWHQRTANHFTVTTGDGKLHEHELSQLKESSLYFDAFSYFAQFVRGNVRPNSQRPLSRVLSLETNVMIMRIMDAAQRSVVSQKPEALRY